MPSVSFCPSERSGRSARPRLRRTGVQDRGDEPFKFCAVVQRQADEPAAPTTSPDSRTLITLRAQGESLTRRTSGLDGCSRSSRALFVQAVDAGGDVTSGAVVGGTGLYAGSRGTFMSATTKSGANDEVDLLP
jgi:hypothetical protein